MSSSTSAKITTLPAACQGLLHPVTAAFRMKKRVTQDLHFVIGALLAAGVVVAFVLALHST